MFVRSGKQDHSSQDDWKEIASEVRGKLGECCFIRSKSWEILAKEKSDGAKWSWDWENEEKYLMQQQIIHNVHVDWF